MSLDDSISRYVRTGLGRLDKFSVAERRVRTQERMPVSWLKWLAVLAVFCCDRPEAQKLLTSGRVGGRVDDSGLSALPVVLSWPGNGIRLALEASDSVQVTFQSPHGASSPSSNNFRFILDDDAEEQLITVSGSAFVWRKTRLSPDRHSLTVLRLTEGIYGPVAISNISLGPGGRCGQHLLSTSGHTRVSGCVLA